MGGNLPVKTDAGSIPVGLITRIKDTGLGVVPGTWVLIVYIKCSVTICYVYII